MHVRAAARYHCALRLGSTPTDSDGDGVPDRIDACPCEPGADMPGETASVRGCPFDAPQRPSPHDDARMIVLDASAPKP